MSFPVSAVRARFPALDHRAFFDAPGGTQVCTPAIDRMVAHLITGTANAGGTFATSRAVDRLSAEAHEAMADLLGGRPEEIAFGPNMTSLTLAVSRALARDWGTGDNLIVTRLDHDANVSPWLAVAADRGMEVRFHAYPEDPEWRGWWGAEPPFGCPVFVLTHRSRPPIPMTGGTTFHFISADPTDALAEAKEAANGKDVRIGGGPTVVREYLRAGLVDHLHVAIAPILLGQGVRLWDDLRDEKLAIRSARKRRRAAPFI